MGGVVGDMAAGVFGDEPALVLEHGFGNGRVVQHAVYGGGEFLVGFRAGGKAVARHIFGVIAFHALDRVHGHQRHALNEGLGAGQAAGLGDMP